MKRPTPELVEASGQDSFLDVVTNIVGILIILVMVVGLRSKNMPPTTLAIPPTAAQPSAPDLSQPLATATSLERDVRQLGATMQQIQNELEVKNREREVVGTYIAAGEAELAEERQKLDQRSRDQYDAQRAIASARATLELQSRERESVIANSAGPTEIKNLPTPISHTVFGREVHFHLKQGRIAFVPIDALMDRARDAVREHNASTVEEMVQQKYTAGPIGGFTMRLVVKAEPEPGHGVSIKSKAWRVVPSSEFVGEPPRTALAEHSEFRTALAAFDPRQTTVTIWFYGDSFAEFRQFKEELHRLGFATAGRPLPDGRYIGGSSEGTKSSAE